MGLTIFPSSIVLIEISCVRNLNNDYYYLYLFACIQSFIHSVRLEYMICMKRGEGGQKRGRMVYLNAYTMQLAKWIEQ